VLSGVFGCSLDSDGFPTAEAELASSAGLQGEASGGGDGDEGVAPDMLLLEQAGMGAAEDDGGSVMSGGLSAVYQVSGSCTPIDAALDLRPFP
jgi:hypothetical protein